VMTVEAVTVVVVVLRLCCGQHAKQHCKANHGKQRALQGHIYFPSL
jgi:hypothetical protein